MTTKEEYGLYYNPLGSSPNVINVLSLNCWGLKFLAKHRNARLTEIGAQIAVSSPQPEIVGLQECWTQEDYQSIRKQTKKILPYGKFYHSGIFGGGLAILSRWPIDESSMVRYPLNGRPTAFFRGDWFVGKGIACASLRVGSDPNDVVEVFNTHLHAPYEREPNDSYICHRTAQAWEMSKLLRAAASRHRLVIALGDFNMVPLSLAHRIIITHAPVQDSWRVLHPHSSIGAAIDDIEIARNLPTPTVEFNLRENGATCDSVLNTWRWNKGQQKLLSRGKETTILPSTPDPRAKRLDYIFAGTGSPRPRHPETTSWVVDAVKVGMTERHPTLKCSLSDHFSVEATLSYRHCTTPNLASIPAPTHLLPPETYDEILAMIESYTAREHRQRRLRLSHFVVQVLLTIGCWTAVWWSPHPGVSFALMVVSSIGLAAGVLDGLIGGLFVGSEVRALKEFEWEVRNARGRAAGSAGGGLGLVRGK